MWFCLKIKRKIGGYLGLFYSSQKWDTLGVVQIHTASTKFMVQLYKKHSFLNLGIKIEDLKQFRCDLACNVKELEMFLFHSVSCYDSCPF